MRCSAPARRSGGIEVDHQCHESAATLARSPLDGPPQFAAHHLLDDLRAQASHGCARREAEAIVRNGHRHRQAFAPSTHFDTAIAVSQAVLDGVRYQLVEDRCQRLRLVGGNCPELAGRNHLDTMIGGGDCPRHAHNRAGNLVEVDGFINVLGQGGVHSRNGLNAAFCLSEGDLDGVFARASRL